MPDVTLATLVAARLCHDLISPVGAIGNGLELLRLTDGPAAGPEAPDGEELTLIAASLDHAEARLRFFRIAFGTSSPEQEIGAQEVVDVLAALAGSRRARLDWQPSGPLPRAQVRLALLALMCLEAAMPWGGVITISRNSDIWHVTGSAERLRIDPALWGALAAPAVDIAALSAAQVEFALLPALCADCDRSVSVQRSETAIALRF